MDSVFITEGCFRDSRNALPSSPLIRARSPLVHIRLCARLTGFHDLLPLSSTFSRSSAWDQFPGTGFFDTSYPWEPILPYDSSEVGGGGYSGGGMLRPAEAFLPKSSM